MSFTMSVLIAQSTKAHNLGAKADVSFSRIVQTANSRLWGYNNVTVIWLNYLNGRYQSERFKRLTGKLETLRKWMSEF